MTILTTPAPPAAPIAPATQGASSERRRQPAVYRVRFSPGRAASPPDRSSASCCWSFARQPFKPARFGGPPYRALDSVTFVSLAQSFDRDGWLTTLASDPSPPLFPMLVNRVHALLTTLGVIAAPTGALRRSGVGAQPGAGSSTRLRVVSLLRTAPGGLRRRLVILRRDGCGPIGRRRPQRRHAVGVLAGRLGMHGSFSRRPGPAIWRASDLAARCRGDDWPGAIVPGRSSDRFAGHGRHTARRMPGEAVAPAKGAGARRAGAGARLYVCRRPLPGSRRHVQPCRGAGAARRAGVGPGDMAPLNATAAEAERVASIANKPDWQLPDGRPMVFGRKDFSSSTRFHGLASAAFELLASWPNRCITASACWLCTGFGRCAP